MSKILAQSIFFIQRPHDDTRINASKCFKFQSTFAITLHPILFGKSTFTYSRACQAEVAVIAKSKLKNRNCKSCWNLEVFAKVPRLEYTYAFICKLHKLQPLYFVTNNFWRGLHYEGSSWKVCKAHFCEVPQNQNKKKLTAKLAFERCWRLQYRTLHPPTWQLKSGMSTTWVNLVGTYNKSFPSIRVEELYSDS